MSATILQFPIKRSAGRSDTQRSLIDMAQGILTDPWDEGVVDAWLARLAEWDDQNAM